MHLNAVEFRLILVAWGGYEDLKDAERLAADLNFRLISSQRISDRSAVLTSALHWFETELLAREENLSFLRKILTAFARYLKTIKRVLCQWLASRG